MAGQVYAESDSAEDTAEDADAAVDEEEDEDEMVVEEDQMQNSVRRLWAIVLQNVKRWHVTRWFCVRHQDGGEDDSDEAAEKRVTSHPDADTTIIFTTGEGWGLFFKKKKK